MYIWKNIIYIYELIIKNFLCKRRKKAFRELNFLTFFDILRCRSWNYPQYLFHRYQKTLGCMNHFPAKKT